MLALGLMSGTSLDGIDASIIDTDGIRVNKVVANYHLPYSNNFKARLKQALKIQQASPELIHELTVLHARIVESILQTCNMSHSDIEVIGFHGQTITHQPEKQYTLQIGDPQLLNVMTKIKVCGDLRINDVKNSGQGAPLVPIFHKALCLNRKQPLAIINVGGVANLTYIDQEDLIGFDTGPGNALIDDAMRKLFNKDFDNQGKIAYNGRVHDDLVEKFLQDPYFSLSFPKSLDRDHFTHLAEIFSHLSPEDQIACLSLVTVKSIISSFELLPKVPKQLYFCGGGVHNKFIMDNMNSLYYGEIFSISELGFNSDFIESAAMAFIAVRTILGMPSTFPSTTGCFNPLISGAIYGDCYNYASQVKLKL